MLTAKKLMVPSSEEVRSEAVQTLIKRMGITKAAIFIRENMAQIIKGTLPFFRLFSAMLRLPRTVFDDIPHHVTQR